MRVFIILIFIWYLFTNSSEKSEWYVELYTMDNVTVKISRDRYNEFKELWNVDNYTENQRKNYYNIRYNESVFYTELQKTE